MTELLSESEARRMVEAYVAAEKSFVSTQEILDSGAIPRLRRYKVKPGKVSDSIFGGRGSHIHDKGKLTEKVVEFENSPLYTEDGIPLRIMVRTDRISTHDINRGSIPFKDQILAENHHYMRRLLRDTLGTSQFDVDGHGDNSIIIAAENLKQIAVEMVVRAYMAKSTTSTSLYQAYVVRGERRFSGHMLLEGLFTNGPLPYVMDTPSTKSEKHDETVDPAYLFDIGVCTPQQYKQICNAALVAFGQVSEFLRKKGIIAVDTKTEHGINRLGQIVSQDELWTMDSSRFWLEDDYKKQLRLFLAINYGDTELLAHIKETQSEAKEKDYLEGGRVVITPRSYSKEFARGFSQGDKGYSDEQRIAIAVRYILGIQNLLGRRFEPDMRSREERVVRGLETVVRAFKLA